MLRPGESGSTLLAAVATVAILALIAATTFLSITTRFRANYHTAGWHDALTSAESGVQYALARLRSPLSTSGVLTDPLKVPGSLQSDLASLSPGGTSTNGTVLSGTDGATTFPRLQLPTLTIPHIGEGSSQFTATVTIDAVPASYFTTSGTNAWYRIRSVGKVPLSGRGEVGVQKYDGFLRKLQFKQDSAGAALARPQAVRTIEIIAKPVTIGSAALFGVTGIDLNNHNVTINSYDSRSALTSTGGIYDPAKATANGDIVTDDATTGSGTPGVINLSPTGAHVYGDVATNNTPVSGSAANVSGTITQDFYQYLPPPPDPAIVSTVWTSISSSVSSLTTGTQTAPTRYKMNGFGDLTLSGNSGINVIAPTSGEGYAEIWVPRDLTLTGNGGFNIPAHVHVTFYVDGAVKIAGNGVVNTSQMPSNVILYGNHDPNVLQNMTVDGNGQFAGMIYAPSATVSVKGGGSSGDMYGSIFANNINFVGATSLHYDSAQGDVSSVVDYRIGSWYEDTTLAR